MTQSHAVEDAILGGERISDGLWTHRGKLVVNGDVQLKAGVINASEIAQGAVMVLQVWYIGTPSVSTPQGSWFEVVASRTSVTCYGRPIMIDINASLQHTVAGAGLYLGFMLDGGAQTYVFTQTYAANALIGMALNHVTTPAAGPHTFSIGILTFTTGTLSLNNAVYTSMRALELRNV